jgi:glutamine amidotransferase
VGRGVPLFGICLGMQLFFDESLEYGVHRGLGLIPGIVRPVEPADKTLKTPHMGWNALHITQDSPILKNTREGEHVYYVHSFWADTPAEYITATSEYGMTITAAVQRGNVLGTQFHPEKSGAVGLKMLRDFCDMEVDA